jgi:DNA repair protein RecO (recombination protein O)
MLQKTRGIVFKVTDYGDNSVVVQIFTEKFGLQSYLINGVKKSKARISRNMLQPLHLLDLVVYHKNTGSIQRIKELKNDPVLQTIPYDIVKSSIVLFLNEVLYKAIKQNAPDEFLFNYIFHSLQWLDEQDSHIVNFHLVFLTGLTRFLGFFPDATHDTDAAYFDMKNGVFTKYKPESLQYMSPPHTQNFYQLLHCKFETIGTLKISNEERRYLVTHLLEYYALHIEGFGSIRSHEILEEVLS